MRGFTLIELSIVLVIIGLLVGGVLVGQSLIRQAQIQSVMVETSQFVHAVEAFRQKYGSSPGDMANATNYWGSAGGNSGDNYTASCYGSAGTGTHTCNGNGDGTVHNWTADLARSDDSDWAESFLFWQHLANAEMIAGHYSGIVGPAGGKYDTVPGFNAPASKLTPGGYGIIDYGAGPHDGVIFDALYKHTLVLGAPLSGGQPWNPLLTASEAAAIDIKYDDGLPQSGKVMTTQQSDWFTTNCALYPYTGYNVTSTGPQCKLLFITGF